MKKSKKKLYSPLSNLLSDVTNYYDCEIVIKRNKNYFATLTNFVIVTIVMS